MAEKPVDFSEAASESRPRKKKPVMSVDDARRFDPAYWAERDHDPSWVHGYSETVQANDLERTDELTFRNALREAGSPISSKEDVYEIIGAKPQKLKYRLAWLPIAAPNGGRLDAGSRKMLRDYKERKGYRLVSAQRKEDGSITGHPLDEMGWEVTDDCWMGEDGTIRRGAGDLALYYCDGEVARKWDQWAAKEAARADGKELPDALATGGLKAETFEEADQREEGRYAD